MKNTSNNTFLISRLKLLPLFIIFISAIQAYAQYNYPITKTLDSSSTFFGTRVQDPYRWLEQENAPEVKEWVKAQSSLTNGYLKEIPFREKIRKKIAYLKNTFRYSAPYRIGEYYFFYQNTGQQQQSVIYRKKGLKGKAVLFIDPNKLSKEGTTDVTLGNGSKDGKYATFFIQEAGSDWQKIVVMEVATAKRLTDTIKWVKSGFTSWKGDGFYYSRYPKPTEGKEMTSLNESEKVYFHKLGSSQETDKLIFEDKENTLNFATAFLDEDKRYLFVMNYHGNYIIDYYFRDSNSSDTTFRPLIKGKEHVFDQFLDVSEGKILLKTNRDAPNGKIVSIDLKNLSPENWKTLVAEKKEVIEGVSTTGEKLFIAYLKDATSRLYQHDYNGKLEREIILPGLGTAQVQSGLRKDKSLFYYFSSFTDSRSTYQYDIVLERSTLYFKIDSKINKDDYVTKQVFYKSKDGTKVPMFIFHKKGLIKDGSHPTLLYAYGGFSINTTPYFDAAIFPLLDEGGIYAVANIRGGGEYGEAWHQGGMLLKTQNRFDDFIAAAEYLIAEQYTSSKKLGISGASHGGCLIGSVMLQRPELFKVALPEVGVLDMLRFHKFTIGWNWMSEFGCPDSLADFRNLLSYSPVHNVKKEVKYPSTLVMTSDHDDRVAPAHSFKFISELQAKHAGANPVLIRIETNSGHGSSSLDKLIANMTDQISFLLYETRDQ